MAQSVDSPKQRVMRNSRCLLPVLLVASPQNVGLCIG